MRRLKWGDENDACLIIPIRKKIGRGREDGTDSATLSLLDHLIVLLRRTMEHSRRLIQKRRHFLETTIWQSVCYSFYKNFLYTAELNYFSVWSGKWLQFDVISFSLFLLSQALTHWKCQEWEATADRGDQGAQWDTLPSEWCKWSGTFLNFAMATSRPLNAAVLLNQ